MATGFTPPPIADASAVESSPASVQLPEAKVPRTGAMVTAMAAVPTHASGYVTPNRWRAKNPSSPSVQSSNDLDLAAAEAEIDAARAEEASARVRAAESKFRLMKAQKERSRSSRGGSAIGSSEAFDLTRELSGIMNQSVDSPEIPHGVAQAFRLNAGDNDELQIPAGTEIYNMAVCDSESLSLIHI